MSEAFYEPLGGGRFRSTDHTAGPWDARSQHAGPPAALLGRALEATDPREGTLLSRVTFEILGPVPVAEVEVESRVARPGRTVELLEAELRAGGRPVMTARAWRLPATEAPAAGDGAAAAARTAGGGDPAAARLRLRPRGRAPLRRRRLVRAGARDRLDAAEGRRRARRAADRRCSACSPWPTRATASRPS